MTAKKTKRANEKIEIILDASKRVLARYGYAKTTIAKVAEEAGVSRGLLHYHFKNKEEMLARVLRANMEEGDKIVTDIINNCTSVEMVAKKLVETFKKIVQTDPDYFYLFLEGLGALRHSETVRNELMNLYDSFRNSLKISLSQLEKKGVISPAIHPDGLASLITGILDGMGIALTTMSGLKDNEENWHSVERGFIALMAPKK